MTKPDVLCSGATAEQGEGDIMYCPANNSIGVFYDKSRHPDLTMRVVPVGRLVGDFTALKEMDGTRMFRFDAVR